MTKQRISISIDENVLTKLDREVDGKNILSRSEAVEKIINKHIADKKACVILAGGRSESLFVRKANTYRPLLNIGKKLLIADIISKAKEIEYSNILIVGSKEVLSSIYNSIGDGKALGVTVEYIEEKEHLGTGKTLAHVKDRIKDTFLFIPCDHYFEIDLKKMEQYHKTHKGTVTLAVYSGTRDKWTKTANVELEGDLIKEYTERPKSIKTHLTSLMIGFAEPEIFNYIPSGNLTWSLQENVFTQIAKKGSLVGYVFSGRWKNVHDIDDADEIKRKG